MKKILAILLLTAAGSAMAQHHGHFHRHWHPNYGWVFPTIIGGVVGYEIARQQQPVIVQQPPVNCSAWREIQQSDGVIVRERICTQ